MKRLNKVFLIILILITSFTIVGCNKSNKQEDNELKYSDDLFPNKSTEFSLSLAKLSLNFIMGNTKEETKQNFENENLEVLMQKNYEKDLDDPNHTNAFTIGKKTINDNGLSKDLIVVALNESMDGDWLSNFDFAPSHNDETKFSENFLYCALDVYTNVYPLINDNTLVLVTGYSRGGACANLLGMLLNASFNDNNNLYVYTFASPRTVRKEYYTGKNYYNIFNIINESDISTQIPFEELGYSRLGYDIVLNNKQLTQTNEELIDILNPLCPSISSYYLDRHAITSSGISDDGLTMYEIAVMLLSTLNSKEESSLSNILDLINILSEDSDLFPLYSECVKLYSNGSFKKMGNEHNLNQYKTLLENYKIGE